MTKLHLGWKINFAWMERHEERRRGVGLSHQTSQACLNTTYGQKDGGFLSGQHQMTAWGKPGRVRQCLERLFLAALSDCLSQGIKLHCAPGQRSMSAWWPQAGAFRGGHASSKARCPAWVARTRCL